MRTPIYPGWIKFPKKGQLDTVLKGKSGTSTCRSFHRYLILVFKRTLYYKDLLAPHRFMLTVILGVVGMSFVLTEHGPSKALFTWRVGYRGTLRVWTMYERLYILIWLLAICFLFVEAAISLSLFLYYTHSQTHTYYEGSLVMSLCATASVCDLAEKIIHNIILWRKCFCCWKNVMKAIYYKVSHTYKQSSILLELHCVIVHSDLKLS